MVGVAVVVGVAVGAGVAGMSVASLEFVVTGDPVAKGRARSTKSGRHYTPTKTRDWENWVAMMALSKVAETFTGPVRLTLVARVRRPKSRPKRCRLPDRRPDLDNYIKAAMDGLQKSGVWIDDAQVCELIAEKVYHDKPGLEIKIEALDYEEKP